MISDYFNLGLRNLRKRKLRSWLTILGVIISIATIFMLVSVSLGLEGAIKEQFRLLGTDKFFVVPGGQIAGPGTSSAAPLTLKDVSTIEKVSGVKDLSYSAFQSVEIEFADQKRFVSAIGMPDDYSNVYTELEAYKIDEGRILEDADEGKVMIGSQYKYNNFFKKPVRAGDTILINEVPFRVTGILQSLGNPADDRLIYMDFNDLQSIKNDTLNIDQIIVQINPGENIGSVIDRTDRRLMNSRSVEEKTKDFTILSPEELLASFGNILNIITSFLLGVAGISLLVGGIGIANTMFTSVLERTREIGTMKAIGAKNKDILLIFLVESGLLGLAGGVMGVLLGIFVSKSIEYIAINQLDTTLLQAATPAYLIIGCLIFAFSIGAVSGVWPAWRASKIKTVDALRYE